MPEDNNQDGRFEWRDVAAMIIAAFSVILPYIIIIAVFCAAVALVLRLVAR